MLEVFFSLMLLQELELFLKVLVGQTFPPIIQIK